MGFSIKSIIKAVLQKGIRVGYSTGPMFDPTYQVRTDAVKDILDSDIKKKGETWDSYRHGKNGRKNNG